MKKILKTGIILFGMLLFSIHLPAQTTEWKTATSKDGKVTAKYNFSSRINENGDKVPVVETIASTTQDISMESCIALMRDISKHKDFRGEKSSRLIETISENEWIIYYYNEKSLITPAVDGSYTMLFEEDKKNKTATFTITADPSLVKETDASRITYAKEVYSFSELKDNQLEITIKTTVSPGFKVPAMLMKKAFPKKIFDNMNKFIAIADKEKK